MYIFIVSMDSWHIANGRHCPNTRISLPGRDIKHAFNLLLKHNRWVKDLKSDTGRDISDSDFVGSYSRLSVIGNGVEGEMICYEITEPYED